jgi:hypothetical protein
MLTRWVCDFCGYEGPTPGDVPPEQVQCPMCGEPVSRRCRRGQAPVFDLAAAPPEWLPLAEG